MANAPLSPRSYDVGDVVRATASFKVGGVLTDPSTITFKYKNPTGTIATKLYSLGEVTKDSTGIFHYDLPVDAAGTWYYRWSSTGTAAGAAEVQMQVRESEFS
jgi:hypothetical protein